MDLGVPGPGPGGQACLRDGAAFSAGGPDPGSGGGSCRQERCLATVFSTCPARLCPRVLVGRRRGARNAGPFLRKLGPVGQADLDVDGGKAAGQALVVRREDRDAGIGCGSRAAGLGRG